MKYEKYIKMLMKCNQIIEISNAYAKMKLENQKLKDFLESKTLKCVICGRTAVYVFRGNSYCVACFEIRKKAESTPYYPPTYFGHKTNLTYRDGRE